MEETPQQVVEHYDNLAEEYQKIAGGPGKHHIVLPAFRSLLPELSDARLLDAGCGDGYNASWFATQGADVVGIDVSERMVEVARERYGEDAEFCHGDLTDGLAFEADTFDIVVCQHVLSHLPSLETPLEEFARVLRPGGTLVVTTHHPFHDFLVARDEEYPDTPDALGLDLDPLVVTDNEGSQYHETERFEIYWGGNRDATPGTYYRRPVSDLIQELLDAGLELRELVEPTPDETFREEYPDLAAELSQRPSREICLRAER